jgi:hypothetical protein
MRKLLLITAAAAMFTTSAMACSMPELCATGPELKAVCSKPVDFERVKSDPDPLAEFASRCQSVGLNMKIKVEKSHAYSCSGIIKLNTDIKPYRVTIIQSHGDISCFAESELASKILAVCSTITPDEICTVEGKTWDQQGLEGEHVKKFQSITTVKARS